MKRYCLTLDLKNDPNLIQEYEAHHQQIWPEIEASLRSVGIENLEIYRIDNRMFMIMETIDSFSFAHKEDADGANIRVQEWENLMWKYQQPLPTAKPGEKWILMKKIFDLNGNE